MMIGNKTDTSKESRREKEGEEKAEKNKNVKDKRLMFHLAPFFRFFFLKPGFFSPPPPCSPLVTSNLDYLEWMFNSLATGGAPLIALSELKRALNL